ncbi:MAG: hypothetical protein P4M00_01490 [Azospirillaceae bacterium]|nr:hypothetical protein [Azospirillaceae bacterium]
MPASVSLADLSLAHFEPHLDSTFQVAWEGRTVTLTLVAASTLGTVSGPPGVPIRTEPFQLEFLESQGSLPQHIHTLSHPVLGDLSIFLVPVGPDPEGKGYRYQAAFT